MDNMYLLANQEGIMIHISSNLGNGIDGIYLEEPGGIPLVIGLNKAILSNIPHVRCVLAEELGHHYTTVGSHIKKEFYCYADRLITDKTEYKALKWAANYLMPENELLDVLRDGLCETWELAEHFCVTEKMMQFRIKLFRGD